MSTREVLIEGMTCDHCTRAVKNALEQVEGVTSARVDLASRIAVIDGNAVSENAIASAIENAGYQVVIGNASSRPAPTFVDLAPAASMTLPVGQAPPDEPSKTLSLIHI